MPKYTFIPTGVSISGLIFLLIYQYISDQTKTAANVFPLMFCARCKKQIRLEICFVFCDKVSQLISDSTLFPPVINRIKGLPYVQLQPL
jgi:hypothetical protein